MIREHLTPLLCCSVEGTVLESRGLTESIDWDEMSAHQAIARSRKRIPSWIKKEPEKSFNGVCPGEGQNYITTGLKIPLQNTSQDIKTDPYLRPVDEARDVYKKYLIHDLKIRKIDRIVLVAVEDRKIIAYIRGTLTKTLHVLNVKLREVIGNLYVEEKYRRKGVAKNLIEELIRWFKGKNVDVMTVHVYLLNSKAIALYKKFGFKEYSLNMNRRL